MDLWVILQDVVALLAAALVCGGIVSHWGQSPIVGYLLAGMVLGGPGSIGLIKSQQEVESIAELGVALLLFSLGLEFSLDRLRRLGARPLLAGVVQVVFTLLLGAAVLYPLGNDLRSSLAFGAMISLSSTAIVLRILMERSEIETLHGRNCLAVLLTQDMAVVPLALMMTVLGGTGGFAMAARETGRLLLSSTLLVLGLWALNRVAVQALGTLTLQRNRELTVIFAVTMGLGAAWGAHRIGISPALGAFVAGMLLGSSPFATQIRADISSLRVLLLTLFFSAAGMVADPLWIFQHWGLVLGTTLALTIGKLVVVWGIFRWLGQPTRTASASGICLAQVGEFAFVLGMIGKSNGVVSNELYALVISTTIATFVLSALMVPLAGPFGSWMSRLLDPHRPKSDHATPESSRAPDVVIIGFGPAGQAAAQPLLDQNLIVTVIDLNHEGVRLAQQWGLRGEIGDATQIDVLEHAKIPLSRVVVITVPYYPAAMAILDNVRHLAPHAYVLVRSRYKVHSNDFASHGGIVIGDEEEIGAALGACLTSHLATWSQSENEEEN